MKEAIETARALGLHGGGGGLVKVSGGINCG